MMVFPHLTTVDEFVAWEDAQERKFEFADGSISPFPGGTLRHEIIVANLIAALHHHLGAGRVRGSGLKTLTRSSSRYPDVSVSHAADAPIDGVEQTFARHPLLVIEVLSPSTQSVDRGPKFDEYRSIATLREYVLIDSRKRWAQTARRNGDDWVVSLPLTAGELTFASVGCTLCIDIVYAGSGLDFFAS